MTEELKEVSVKLTPEQINLLRCEMIYEYESYKLDAERLDGVDRILALQKAREYERVISRLEHTGAEE